MRISRIAAVMLLAGTLPRPAEAVQPAIEQVEALASLEVEAGAASHARLASEPSGTTFVHGFETPPLGSSAEIASLEFARRWGLLLGILPAADTPRLHSTVSWKHHSIVRLEMNHLGLPVFDRMALVRVDPSGAVSAVASDLVPLDAHASPVPALTSDVAGDAARALLPWPAHVRTTRLGWWIDPAGEGVLAWKVALRGPLPHQAALVMIDAVDGRVLATGSPVIRAQGRVWLDNPVRDDHLPSVVELPRLTGDGTVLTGEYVTTWLSVPDSAAIHTAIADASGDFLYDPVAMEDEPGFDDPFAEVTAYYNGDRLSDYYRENHGYTQPPGPIDILVNYVETAGTPYDNAWYDSMAWSITLGQATEGDFAYDTDTLWHEFTHSVVDQVAHLMFMGWDVAGSNPFPMAIHEGLADSFPASIHDDPDLGEYIFGRHMVNDRTCPADIVGEEHWDGEILGGTNWEIHELVGGEDQRDLMYGALTLLPPSASYRDYADGMMATAEAMQTAGDLTPSEVSQIETILDDRGVSVCERFLSLDDGSVFSLNQMGLDDMMGFCGMRETMKDQGYSFPPTFQWTIDVPPDATSLSIDVTVTSDDGSDAYDYWVHVRRGEYVLYEMVEIFSGFTIPLLVDQADATFENPEGSVVLDLLSDPALDPGETYYFAVNYLGCPGATIDISADVGFEPMVEPEPEPEPEPEATEEIPEGADEEPEPADDVSTEPDAPADVPSEPPDGSIRGGACGCTLVG